MAASKRSSTSNVARQTARAAAKARLTPPARDALILAIDIGTSSLRTALFSVKGERHVSTTAQESYSLRVGADGTAELDPAVLLAAWHRCLRSTLDTAAGDPALRGKPIIAAGTSTFMHSLIGVNAAGAALTPIYTWADSRCSDHARGLREKFDEADVHARTGCMLRSSFWPAKFAWLQATAPKLVAKVVRWMSPAEWLQTQVAERTTCSFSMASGTGILSPRGLKWDDEWLQHFRLTAAHFHPLGEEPSPLNAATIAQYPELAATQFYPALADGAASNLGSGATEPGVAAINVGTSAAVRIVVRARSVQVPLGLFCYRVDAERYLVGGAVSNAGNLRQWTIENCRTIDDPVALESELAKRPSPRHGLTILPFWVSERAPTWAEDLPGMIVGLTQATTAVDLLQATTEAVYQRLAQIAALLPGARQGLRFVASGGIQRSRSSLQRLCHVLGHPVYASSEPEASIRGAAVFVLEKLGVQVAAPKLGAPLKPVAAIHAEYAAATQRQAELEKAMAMLAGV